MRLGQQGWHAACTHAAAAERGGTTIMVTPIAIDLLLSTYCYRPIAIDIDAMVDFGRSTKFEIVQQGAAKIDVFRA